MTSAEDEQKLRARLADEAMHALLPGVRFTWRGQTYEVTNSDWPNLDALLACMVRDGKPGAVKYRITRKMFLRPAPIIIRETP